MGRFFRWLKGKIFGTPKPPTVTPKAPDPLPPELEGKVPHVVCKQADWFTERDTEILNAAVAGLNKILATPEFKIELLKRTYSEDMGEGGQGVWNRMVKGDQLVVGDDLSDLDFKIVMYNSPFSRVVGYTYLESLVINVNRKFFSTPKYVASNILHELTHTLGYTHDYGFGPSVPYQMNEIVELLWDDLGL